MEQNKQTQLEIINQQIKELVGIYRGAVSRSGISENEYWIWYALVNMDCAYTQQDICGLWSLSKQTVNTIITHMARRGYVVLEAIPGTRNRKQIILTDSGRAYGKAILSPVTQGEQRALERLPGEELDQCIRSFGRFICILKEELNGNEKL